MKEIVKTIALCCTIFLTSLSFAEPANLSLLQNEIQRYHDSGSYDEELKHVITRAQHYIDQQVLVNNHSKCPKKLAIVLDIDETSLSNYNNMIKRHFAADHEQIHKDILAANAPAIKPMLSLYHDALKRGVQVFFVTGRPSSELTATRTNLLHAGYDHWAGLYLRPDNYKQSSIIPYKSKTREAITKQGYIIIASIGDQYSDIKGGFAQKGFKLPNPFYYLP